MKARTYVGTSAIYVVLATLSLCPEASAETGAGNGGADHRGRIDEYEGPQTCLECHDVSKVGTNIVEDLLSSVHFQLRGSNPSIDMPGGGAHGMIDRACGLPGSSAMANNYVGRATSPVMADLELDEGCGQCHIASLPPYYYTSPESSMNDLDCLRCHATVYGEEWEDPDVIATHGTNPDLQYREVALLPDGTPMWTQDRSLMTAQSVGSIPTANACLRCHDHAMSGYKRGTPYEADSDVHAAAGIECAECHVTERHKIARGDFVSEMVANEMPGAGVSCGSADCHGEAPHAGTNAAALNNHVTNMACEVCHIPSLQTKSENILARAWAPSTLNPITGAWEDTPSTTDGYEYPDFWDAYTEYYEDFTEPGDPIPPAIRWFNGAASMLAQPFGGYEDRVSEGGRSKLFAFKRFVNGMLFDASWLPGPNCNDPRVYNCVTETYPSSMKDFYVQNWDTFYAFGFVDEAYPTPESYFLETDPVTNELVRPYMSVMLNMFPMMLQFDRVTYMGEGGEVAGTPGPGVQSAATYPGLVRAINIGMGRMGVDMGYFPPPQTGDPICGGDECSHDEVQEHLAMYGGYMWSGEFFGMWVPPNMDPTSPFYGEVASLITLSHGVRGADDMDLSCFDCHMTREEYLGPCDGRGKRLDFGLLGYRDGDDIPCIDPMHEGGASPEVCDDAVDNDLDSYVDCADPDCSGEPDCRNGRYRHTVVQ